MAVSAVRGCRVSDAGIESARECLDRFVKIPSVSNPRSPDYSMEHLSEAGSFVRSELDRLGFDTKEVSIDGSAPYVIAEKICNIAAPTILLYGHYDVHHVYRSGWDSDPFIIEERDGRLYGRGTGDKGGIVAILIALGTLIRDERELPVNIKVLVEGEAEVGSSHMRALLRQEAEGLQADALVAMSGVNRDADTGTLTSSTRGFVSIDIEVTALKSPVHSGVGCLVPDPAQDLARLIGSLSEPRCIPGFMDDCRSVGLYEAELLRESSLSDEEYARALGVEAGGSLRGDPSEPINVRIEGEPSLGIMNMVCGERDGRHLIQDKASATVGVRLVPDQDPCRVSQVIVDYLKSQSRFMRSGVVKIESPERGYRAWKADLNGPLSKAYLDALQVSFPRSRVEPCGGALPLLQKFKQLLPKMEIIVPGVKDPECAAHNHNESMDLSLWRRAMDALIVFLQNARSVRVEG